MGASRRLGVSGWRVDHEAPGTLDSALSNPHSVLRLFLVGLTVPVGRGIQLVRSRARETRQGVRHIIATRDEVRPHAADQQGRWSLPGAKGIRGRLGVGGWRLADEAPGTLDSALDAALCTP